MLMWNRVRRYRALPPEARWLFVRAAVLLPTVAASLKVRGFLATQQSLQKHVFPRRAGRFGGSASDQVVAWNVRMVHAAARHLWPHSTCLGISLALWHLLRWQGIDSTIRVGTRKTSGEFEAHAWVECDGVAVNEPHGEHLHYAAFEAEWSSIPETP